MLFVLETVNYNIDTQSNRCHKDHIYRHPLPNNVIPHYFYHFLLGVLPDLLPLAVSVLLFAPLLPVVPLHNVVVPGFVPAGIII